MTALRSRCGHYIFVLFLSFFLLLFPHVISAIADWMCSILPHMVWPYSANLECRSEIFVLHAARWKYRTQKNRQKITITQICRAVSSQLRHVSTIRKKLNSNTSSICAQNMVNFGPLTAEIGSGVWGTPANFNGFCLLAALLHSTLVVGFSQTLRRWT